MANVLDVSLDLIPAEIHLVIGKRKFISHVDNLGIDVSFEGSGISVSYVNNDGKTSYIIGVRKKEIENIGLIAHECNHILEYIFEDFGFTDRHECKSYMMETLMNNILRKIKKDFNK